MARNLGTSVRNSAIVKVAPVFFEPSAIRTPSKTKTMLNQPHLQNTLGQTRTERRIISFKTQGLQTKVVGKKIADVGFVPIPVPTAASSSFKPSVSKPPLAKNKEQLLVSSAIQTSSYGQKVAKAQAQASTKVRAGNQALQANANAKQATLNSSLEVQTNPYKEWFKNASHQFMPHCDSENKGFVKGHGHPCPPSDMVLSSKSKSVADMKKNQNQVKPKDDRCPLAPRKCKVSSRLEDFLHSTKSFQEKTHSVRHDHQVMENESWIEFSTPEKQMGSYDHKSCPQAPAKGELLSHFDGLALSPYKEWFINASHQSMPHCDFENKGFVKDHGRPYPPSDMVLSSKSKSVADMKKNQNQVKPKDDQFTLAPRKCKARSCLEDFLHSTKSFQEKTHSIRHDHQVMENESWIEFSTPKKQMGSYHHKSCPQSPAKGELLSHFDGLTLSPFCNTLSFDDNVSLNTIMYAPGLKMVIGVDQNIGKVSVSQGQTLQESFVPVKKEDEIKSTNDKSLKAVNKFKRHISKSFLDDIKAAIPTPVSKIGRIVEAYRQLECFKSVQLRFIR